jgi:DNA transposition AAA+ family ATPase
MSIELAGTGADAPEATTHPYTPAELDQVRTIGAWLKEHGHSRAWLAKRTRISSTTISQVLACKYPSPPAEFLSRMVAVLRVEDERQRDGTPGYVEGSVHKLVWVVCDRTRKHGNFGVIAGAVGVGKTRSLREYTNRTPQTLMVEANPAMTPGTLLTELLEQLNCPSPPGLDRKFSALTKALEGTTYLLIADEADTMSAGALHYLRRIRDKAGVGVVLAGTTQLHRLLKPEQGQFDQIRSRVSMWPETIAAITRDDQDDMVREALREQCNADGSPVEAADDVLDALWAYSQGSARVLMESLMPALRDYGLGKLPLTAGLVDAVARKVLFMRKRAAGAGAAA